MDRLRIVSNTTQNLRVNVITGVTTTDTPLAYAAGDPRFGVTPNIVAAAYSNNFSGATSTVLRDLDSNGDSLATQAPPNEGTLNTQFPLGVFFGELAGYDISGLTGTPYASLNLKDSFGFYTISSSGAALMGNFNFEVLDTAAPVGAQVFPAAVSEPGSLSLLVLSALGLFAARRRRQA